MVNENVPASSVPPTATTQRVLVVEDLEDTRASLQELLQVSLGLEVDTAEDGANGLALLRQKPYSLVITDLRMPKVGGMKLIEAIQAESIPVTVIVTTGHGSIKEAVEAMRMGAYDFLTKPSDPQHLCLLVQRALRERAQGLRQRHEALRRQAEEERAAAVAAQRREQERLCRLFEIVRIGAERVSPGASGSLPRAIGLMVMRISSARDGSEL